MRPSKIEKYNLVDIVRAGMKAGKSSRVIAIECMEALRSKGIEETISHKAVNEYANYIRSSDKHVRKDVLQRDRSMQLKLIKKDLDIIELQYRTTYVLLERFEMVNDLPEMFEQRMKQLAEKVEADEADPEYLGAWKKAFTEDLRRKVLELTVLNRELRENAKFMADTRAKAFEFDLIQEYLYAFMEVFREVNADAYEEATQRIAANPRMQRIVEQQQQLRGGEVS